jgi:hypothetical protein
MNARIETRTRSRRPSVPGSGPPSSVDADSPPPPADEDDGLYLLRWTLSEVDDDWPGSYGAARLGIP